MITLHNLVYDIDDIIHTNPDRITSAIIKAKDYKDDPQLPPRTLEKRKEDAIIGECGEIISQKIMSLIKNSQVYQDYISDGIEIDGVNLSGTIEIKVLKEDSQSALVRAIEKHLSHSKVDYVISLVCNRNTRKIQFHRITFTGNGLNHIKSVKRYME